MYDALTQIDRVGCKHNLKYGTKKSTF